MRTEILSHILELFAEMDRRSAVFQLATGLRCLEGCGDCCLSLKVEATPVEMLPAVAELSRRRELEAWHERLATGTYDSRKCLFHSLEPVLPAKGHCLMYAWRPTVCRMFGFAAVRGKDGCIQYGACRRIQEACPQWAAAAEEAIAAGLDVPVYSQFALQVFGQGGESRPFPINQALRLAMERYGLSIAMACQEEQGRHDPTSGRDFPPSKAA